MNTRNLKQLIASLREASSSVWVYHSTSPQAAKQIVATQMLVSKAEPDVYVSSVPQTAYGSAIIKMQIPEKLLILDDEFPDGRMDYRIHVGRNKQLKVRGARIV